MQFFRSFKLLVEIFSIKFSDAFSLRINYLIDIDWKHYNKFLTNSVVDFENHIVNFILHLRIIIVVKSFQVKMNKYMIWIHFYFYNVPNQHYFVNNARTFGHLLMLLNCY